MSSSPTAINGSLCVYGQTSRVATVNGNDFCLCIVQFYGDYCEQLHAFYKPMLFATTAVRLFTMLYIILWALLKTIHLARSGHFQIKKLSVVSLLLVTFGCVVRVIYDIMFMVHPDSAAGTGTIQSSDPELSGFLGALVTITIAFYMASTSLILGFWFDVLQKKLRPTIAARTKVACIIGAALMIVAIPGLFFQIRAIAYPLGIILVLFPLVANVVGMIVLLIAIGCMKGSIKKLAEANRKKQQYAIRVISISVVAWVLYLVSVGLYSVSVASNPATKPTAAYMSIPATLIDLAAQFAIAFCIMQLVDRRGGLPRHIGHIFCGVEIETKSNRGTTSTPSVHKDTDSKTKSAVTGSSHTGNASSHPSTSTQSISDA